MDRKHQYQATYEATVAQYRQTVLSAFENVADTLVSLEGDANTLAQAHRAANAAAATRRDTTSRYLLGSWRSSDFRRRNAPPTRDRLRRSTSPAIGFPSLPRTGAFA